MKLVMVILSVMLKVTVEVLAPRAVPVAGTLTVTVEACGICV